MWRSNKTEQARHHGQTYPEYISEQMERARRAKAPEERETCLANAIAANGLWLRALDIDFIPAELPLDVIGQSAREIRRTEAFRELMANGGGERLAEAGSVDGLVQSLKKKAEEVESRGADVPAINTIHDIQVKVQARTATPRDFARLVAVHRLSSRREAVRQPDGSVKQVVDRELTRRVNAAALRQETERVLRDEDFRYLMEHEHSENLRINALRLQGSGFEYYKGRAEQLRGREASRTPDAPEKPKSPEKQGPAGPSL